MRRLGKILGFLLLSVVGLVVAAYVVRGLVGVGELGDRKAQAREVVETAADRRAEVVAVRDATRPELAFLGEPVASFSHVSCGIGSVEGGWIVQHYEQECVLSAVDAYTADGLGADDLAARLGGRTQTLPGDCRVVVGADRALRRVRTEAAHLRIGVELVEVRHDAEEWERCEAPVDAATVGPFSRVALVDRTAEPTAEATRYVEVAVRLELDPVSLGCSPWGLIFCDEPVDEPVLPGE